MKQGRAITMPDLGIPPKNYLLFRHLKKKPFRAWFSRKEAALLADGKPSFVLARKARCMAASGHKGLAVHPTPKRGRTHGVTAF